MHYTLITTKELQYLFWDVPEAMEKHTYVGGAAEGDANAGHGNHEDNNEQPFYTAKVQQEVVKQHYRL